MNKIRILSSILIITILVLSIPIFNVSASAVPDYSTLRRVHNKASVSDASIRTKISEIVAKTGCDPQNTNKDWLDPFVYEDYGIIAYGVPHGDTVDDSAKNFYKKSTGLMRNSSGVAGEYKYLGVNENGVNITNDKYFYLGASGGTFNSVQDYKDTRWQTIDGASETWKDVTLDQRNQLAHTNFTDDDYITKGEVPLTLKEILGDSLYSKAYIQCAPTMWTVSGSVRLEYDNTNWNTVIIQPIARDTTITASIDAKDTYYIKAGQTEVNVPYKVVGVVGGDIVKAEKIDLLKAMDFVSLGVTVNGNFKDGLETQRGDFGKTYHKEYLHEGENLVTITGSATVTTKFDGDKPITAYAKKVIKIIVEPEPPPAGTGKINVTCLDYDTNEQISGYTMSNIKIDTPTDVTRKEISDYSYKGSYQTDYPFPDYDLYKSKMVSDTTQKVTLSKTKDNVNVYFWYHKQNQESEEVEPPVVEKCDLKANLYDTTVTAGEYIIETANTYDSLGHVITNYLWSAPGVDEKEINNHSIKLMYMTPGVYDLNLSVTCSDNNTAKTSCKITVIEPVPISYIDISGKTKENRKINIDASRSTSGIIPMDWTKTTWKIGPLIDSGAKWEMGVRLSDGTVKTIDQNTDQSLLNGEKSFGFQARYAGIYQVTSTVGNTNNVTDTVVNVISVSPDLAPVAVFNNQTYHTMDYENPLGPTFPKWGKTFIYDNGSYSPDGDTIKTRIWGFRYDSDNAHDANNNPIFTDKPTIYKYTGDPSTLFLQTEGQRLVVDNDNDFEVELWNYFVGHIAYELTVIEDIPESETIKELLVDSDYRHGCTKDW